MPRSGDRTSGEIRFDEVTLVACGWVALTATKRIRELHREVAGYGRYRSRVPVRRSRNVSRQVWSQFLDVVSLGAEVAHLRINAASFDYAGLGERLFATQAANFMAIAGLFAVRSPNARIDDSITVLLDDDPRTLAKFPSREAFANYLLWKSALGRLDREGAEEGL